MEEKRRKTFSRHYFNPDKRLGDKYRDFVVYFSVVFFCSSIRYGANMFSLQMNDMAFQITFMYQSNQGGYRLDTSDTMKESLTKILA